MQCLCDVLWASCMSSWPNPRGEGGGLGEGLGGSEGSQSHLQSTQIQLCRGSETHLLGRPAQPLGSSSQGDRAHSLPMMRPLALSERFQVGRERHPDHLDTSSLEDMGGLRRKRDLGQRQKARKVPPAGLSTLLPRGLSICPGDGLSPGDGQWYPAGQGRHSVRLSPPSAAR